MADFRVKVHDEPGDVRVIEVLGEARIEIAPRLEAAVLEALADRQAPRVVLDLSGLLHLDSASTSALIRLQDAVESERGGTLVLCGLKRVVRRVIDVTGLSARFEIRPDRAGALAHLTKA